MGMSNMVIAIQQPEHIPWIGFFNKMVLVDEYIFLDNVQFKKRYFENRNKIRVADKWDWLTVPVITKGLYKQKINEVEIDDGQDWKRKYLNRIIASYARSAFFEEIFHGLSDLINKEHKKLLELNLALIQFVRNYAGIKTPVLTSSSIIEGKGTNLILDICFKRRANVYLSGPDGRNYLNSEEFQKNNIEIRYHDYVHPEYRQLCKPFISHMSVLDLLFNYGRDAIEIINMKGNG